MATEPPLEERLARVEAALCEVQRRLDATAPTPDWLERVIGSFKDEPAFEEVLAYGRAFRQADQPPEDAGP